ncbi:hypothetical protein ACFQY7_40320 [Actinomadura luteofluorescens]|uniref:hypothetical protein n=1 Tax=Actinomadura luteofluorescens TaxID=46163 RepID=UPI0036291864
MDRDDAGVAQPGGGARLAVQPRRPGRPLLGVEIGGSRSCLTATSRPSRVSWARQTVPMPPCPSGSVSRYRSSNTCPRSSATVGR